MRIYELVFIIKPDLPQEEVDQVVESVTSALTEAGAKIDNVDQWGKKRLAYRVQKNRDGFYVLIQYSLGAEHSDVPQEIERRLRVADAVIKYLTIRIDEDLARLEKLKARREKRAGDKKSEAGGSGAPARPARPAGPSKVPGAPGASAVQAKPAEKSAPEAS